MDFTFFQQGFGFVNLNTKAVNPRHASRIQARGAHCSFTNTWRRPYKAIDRIHTNWIALIRKFILPLRICFNLCNFRCLAHNYLFWRLLFRPSVAAVHESNEVKNHFSISMWIDNSIKITTFPIPHFLPVVNQVPKWKVRFSI